MRLKCSTDSTHHSQGQPVSCLAWNASGELLTVGDDQKALRWTRDGAFIGAASSLPLFAEDLSRSSSQGPRSTSNEREKERTIYTALDNYVAPGTARTDFLAFGTADGKLVLLTSRLTRPDKLIDAHHGAILCIAWNSDASAILTAGEDGNVKLWSKIGLLRTLFHSQGSPVYAAAWSSDGNQILLTVGCNLLIKSVNPGAKSQSWRAHEIGISCISWSSTSGRIASGGEDRRYKVWDKFGRLLYSSPAIEHAVTAISWSLLGDCFAVGSFNSLRVCDKVGWTQAITELNGGSIYSMAWTPDGTALACATSLGHIVCTHVLEKRVCWRHLIATLVSERQITVFDISSGTEDTFEFRDAVSKFGVAHNSLVAFTSGQAHVLHQSKSLHSFELPVSHGRLTVLCQSKSYFALCDLAVGVTVFAYSSGKPVSTIRLARPDLLTTDIVALSDDTLIIQDQENESHVIAYEVQSGETIATLKFNNPVRKITIDQVGSGHLRQIAVIDTNGDLWLSLLAQGEARKACGMAEDVKFSEDSPLLCSVADGRVTFWLCPGAVFADPELVSATRVVKDTTKDAEILWFTGLQCFLRAPDGTSLLMQGGDAFALALHENAARKKWESCLRLCRSAKSTPLWATLASLAILGNDLNTAEVAYAALGESHKVQAICGIRELASPELRTAETLVFRRLFREAENMFLGSGNVYSAIRMWLNACHWDKALGLANRYKTYLAVVQARRQEYLARVGMEEVSKKFLQANEGGGGSGSGSSKFDRSAAQSLIEQEERKRTGGGGSGAAQR